VLYVFVLLFDFCFTTLKRDSTDSAEELFLHAIAEGRDVVLDGTCKWAPFVTQTIQMVRQAHAMATRRGPGFVGPGNERYWAQDERRATEQEPYQIWMLGSFCAVNVAVGRAMRRAVLDGRSASLFDLLRSHKMFAEHFDEYASLVDVALLYDNSRSRPLDVPPPLVLRVVNRERQILDEAAVDKFYRQRFLHTSAKSARELWNPQQEQGEQEEGAPPDERLIIMLQMMQAIE
jgi:hypothetical protein